MREEQPTILKQRPLCNGDRIRITWLPDIWAWGKWQRNTYTGDEGTVEDLSSDGFTLRYDRGGCLIVWGKYNFRFI